MKLDLIAIEKLCPTGLTPLADLRALISLLVAVMKLGMSSPLDMRNYAHMLVQHRNILGERARHNHSLKVKAWVKQCPERTAWVRSVIGETAIRNWVARLRAAYVSGDLQGDRQKKKPYAKAGHKHKPRPYKLRTGKPFALVRLSEVEKLLPRRPCWPRKTHRVIQEAGYALSTGTGNLRHTARLACPDNAEKPHQARPVHSQKPVRFFPSELGVKIRELEVEQTAQKDGEDPPTKRARPDKPDKQGTRPKPRSEKPP